MAKKPPKWNPPPKEPPDPSRLSTVPTQGGPLKRLVVVDEPPSSHAVLDVGTYLLQDGVYRWVPNPDSPGRRAEREDS